MLLIKDVSIKDLSNLCERMESIYPDLTLEECYELTQGKDLRH